MGQPHRTARPSPRSWVAALAGAGALLGACEGGDADGGGVVDGGARGRDGAASVADGGRDDDARGDAGLGSPRDGATPTRDGDAGAPDASTAGADAGDEDAGRGDPARDDAGTSLGPDAAADARDAGASAAGFSGAGRDCRGGEPTSPAAAAMLADVVGFAQGVTGGAYGCVYRVTTLADSGAGSLREGLARSEALWIVFDVSGEIVLRSTLPSRSDKTIDGRGARVVLRDQSLRIAGVSNVVVHNVIFGGVSGGEIDAITIRDDVERVWVDHVSIGEYTDGAIDVTNRSTDVTLSFNRIEDHQKAILVGSTPDRIGDEVIRVTMHHNLFVNTGERHPRLRFGKVHSFNNVFDGWRTSGAGSSMFGELASEANVYIAGANRDAVFGQAIGSDPDAGYARSVDDLLLSGARVRENEPNRVFDPSTFYAYRAAAADEALLRMVEAEAGAHDVARP